MKKQEGHKQAKEVHVGWMEGRSEGKKKAGRREEEMNKEGRQAGRTEGWREAGKQKAREAGVKKD